MKTAKMPVLLAKRPRERRGYPVPYVAMIDASGRPQLTINDAEKVRDCSENRKCGLCGAKLTHGAWFVGGRRCFTSAYGAFVDPPMHEACARYALQVCPYLAAPSYGRRIDDKLLKPEHTPDGVAILSQNMPDARPDTFGLGKTLNYTITPTANGPILVPGKWELIEFWRNGKRLHHADEMAIAQKGLQDVS
jgi:hypothetical protein